MHNDARYTYASDLRAARLTSVFIKGRSREFLFRGTYYSIIGSTRIDRSIDRSRHRETDRGESRETQCSPNAGRMETCDGERWIARINVAARARTEKTDETYLLRDGTFGQIR